jgi:hypothetical protein
MKSIILIMTFFWVIIWGRGADFLSGVTGTKLSFLTGSSVQDTARYVYVGAETCAGKCHNNEELGHQYDSWKKSRHSKSFESLATEEAMTYCKKAGISGKPTESLVCLKCHITAAGYDSTSLGATYKKEDGVTCESCHKGKFIPKTFLPQETDCLKCHNDSVHEISPFDFKESCLKIAHPRSKIRHE